MSMVHIADAIQRLPALLREAKSQPVVVRDGIVDVGAIISMDDLKVLRRAKGEIVEEIPAARRVLSIPAGMGGSRNLSEFLDKLPNTLDLEKNRAVGRK